MFELNQLRCFVAVAEELHFGRAAERLHMTQPPVSRQIQLLEQRLGVALFERTNRSVRLTSPGRRFLVDARQILRLAESATLAVRRAAQGDSGTVTIGFTAASGYGVMPGMIAQCRARLPGVEINLREMVTREQMEALASGELDVALLRPHASLADFESERVMREPLVAALPKAHPLGRSKNPVIRDFEGIPFIMYSPIEARYFHDLVVSAFSAARVTPEYTQYTSQIHSILALVAAGLGVALVPRAATNLHFEGVVYRTVNNLRMSESVELYLAWRRQNDNPARQRVLDACLEYSRLESGGRTMYRRRLRAPVDDLSA
ncbi:MAG: LysR family transcriptional regulator [Gallionella sp.]|jgi:DNA-binding transcriptional LysR family regulator|nr:LysR family transcriptional regulator [Gallionella sp.]